jgi:hypothetical protein
VNLERTKAALAAYDAEVAKPMPDTFREVWAKLNREDRLAREVGRAYGLDTADRNDPATCEACVRPGKPTTPDHPDEPFVRRMVRLYA